jgi:hypothetical protein
MLQKIYRTSEIFKKIPKKNNHPIGENSRNLVTLFGGLARVPLFFVRTYFA